MKKIIGITGSMGSGKSTVRRLLSQKISCIDCDSINASLLEKGAAGYAALKEAGLLCTDENGNPDKKALAQCLQDPQKKRQMESILHPLILQSMQAWMEKQTGLAAVEVPLLFELQLESCFDDVWTVSVSEKTALQRLQDGRHIPQEEALRRLALQMPASEKEARADFVLYNEGSTQDLQKQIDLRLKVLEGGEHGRDFSDSPHFSASH